MGLGRCKEAVQKVDSGVLTAKTDSGEVLANHTPLFLLLTYNALRGRWRLVGRAPNWVLLLSTAPDWKRKDLGGVEWGVTPQLCHQFFPTPGNLSP